MGNKIEQAFERGEKIRKKNWGNQSWYKKYDEKYVIANCGNVYAIPLIDFNSIKNEPEKWEIYHEDLPLYTQPNTLPDTLIINGIKYKRDDN